ncbi:unnamed protein product, partial [Staurois parvus]
PINGKSRRCRLSHVISCVQSQKITDDQCSPSSATCQCSSMPHISAHLSCSASQCHLSVLPISSAYQCQPVPPISARQCCLSVPSNSASQCHLS